MDPAPTLELDPRRIIPALVRNDRELAGGISEYLLDLDSIAVRHRFVLSDLLYLRGNPQGRVQHFYARVLADLMSADWAKAPNRFVPLPYVAKEQLHALARDFLNTPWHPSSETRERAWRAYGAHEPGSVSNVMRVLERHWDDRRIFSRGLRRYEWAWLGDYVRDALAPMRVTWSVAPENVASAVITRDENVVGQMIEDERRDLGPRLEKYVEAHLAVAQQRVGVVTGITPAFRGIRTRRLGTAEIDLGGKMVSASLTDLQDVRQLAETPPGVGSSVRLEIVRITEHTVEAKLLEAGPWVEIDGTYPSGTPIEVTPLERDGDWLLGMIEEGVPWRMPARAEFGLDHNALYSPFRAVVAGIDHKQRTVIMQRYKPRKRAVRLTP